MASLTIVSSRNDDNSTTLTVTLPARRNGEVNFGALARINQSLLVINPDAFDPIEVPPRVETAPLTFYAEETPPPPLVALHDGDDEPEASLNFDKAGQA
jgi:hypothetical protein